jgi:hypothetical protein
MGTLCLNGRLSWKVNFLKSFKTGACSPLRERTLSIVETNRPPLQEQVDHLDTQVKVMREAMASLMAAMLPAFQALEHLEDAARAMSKLDNDD